MRVISCTSYYGTGSSAVTNFFSEFDNVFSLGEYEYRFLHDPDGIADLEYNVVENNNRHNTSDAIKRYIRFAATQKKLGYGGYDIFEDEFEKATEEFIDDITELKAKTWWNKDRLDRGQLFCFIDRVYSFFKRLFKNELKTEIRYSLLTDRELAYYSAVDEETFLKAVRKYVDRLLSFANKNKLPYVMVDQMVPPTNTKRFLRYFDDCKIIATERDPRDIFLLEKYEWKWGVLPVKDVKEYVEWFKITRKYSHPVDEDHSRVLRINFEDMIYKYDETKQILCDFAGIDASHHVNPKTIFDPSRSIKNTNLVSRYPGCEEDIRYIESELKEYLYDFDAFAKNGG